MEPFVFCTKSCLFSLFIDNTQIKMFIVLRMNYTIDKESCKDYYDKAQHMPIAQP